jgi:GntR family transcriptional repressor for pyruvate dehydrogenase complex
MHSFDKIAPRGAYAQVVEQLEERILRGEFPANELLPPEAALAAQLGIGRRVLREALRSLEIKGLVEIRHGIGTLVRRNDLGSFLNALQQNVRSFLNLNRADAEQVRHLRLLFESAAIDCLSERPDAAGLAALSDNLQLQRQAAGARDAVAYQRHHLEFHRRIVNALGNPLIDMLYAQVLELMQPNMEAVAAGAGVMKGAIKEHEAILGALQACQYAEAKRLIQEHLQRFSRRMTEVSGAATRTVRKTRKG